LTKSWECGRAHSGGRSVEINPYKTPQISQISEEVSPFLGEFWLWFARFE
jgi:hypothetical protein